MAENQELSWRERSGRALLSDEQFTEIRTAAAKLPNILNSTYAHLDSQQTQKFALDFMDLRGVGASRTRDDTFAALEGMTKDDLTPAKEEWFKKVARLYRRMANALMQRELDETKAWDAQDMNKVKGVALGVLFDTIRNMQVLEEVYPPTVSVSKST